MPCPQRGSKIIGVHVGAQLHADVFRCAKARGTTATAFLVEVLRGATAEVLNERTPLNFAAETSRPRIPSNLDITARRQLRYRDSKVGRALMRDTVAEIALPFVPAIMQTSIDRTPAWQPGDPKPYGRTHERKPKR